MTAGRRAAGRKMNALNVAPAPARHKAPRAAPAPYGTPVARRTARPAADETCGRLGVPSAERSASSWCERARVSASPRISWTWDT